MWHPLPDLPEADTALQHPPVRCWSKGADFCFHVQFGLVSLVPAYFLFHQAWSQSHQTLQISCLKVQTCKAEHFSVQSPPRKAKDFIFAESGLCREKQGRTGKERLVCCQHQRVFVAFWCREPWSICLHWIGMESLHHTDKMYSW